MTHDDIMDYAEDEVRILAVNGEKAFQEVESGRKSHQGRLFFAEFDGMIDDGGSVRIET